MEQFQEDCAARLWKHYALMPNLSTNRASTRHLMIVVDYRNKEEGHQTNKQKVEHSNKTLALWK